MELSAARFERVFQELKEEYQKTTDHQRRIQILTLSPFSNPETMDFFGATEHMVRAAKATLTHGLLPSVPPFSKGRTVSDGDKQKVVHFYE